MNDLTKEELKTIQELICWGDDTYDPPSERIKSLQAKIQSKIDNYCGCDDNQHIYIPSHSVVNGNPINKCKDCGKTE